MASAIFIIEPLKDVDKMVYSLFWFTAIKFIFSSGIFNCLYHMTLGSLQ